MYKGANLRGKQRRFPPAFRFSTAWTMASFGPSGAKGRFHLSVFKPAACDGGDEANSGKSWTANMIGHYMVAEGDFQAEVGGNRCGHESE